jgi:hypothetical protein
MSTSAYRYPLQLLILVLALVPVPATHAQTNVTQNQPVIQQKQLDDMQLTLTIDRQSIGVADYLNLRLTVELPAGLSVTFAAVDDYLGPFHVISRHPLGPLKTADQRAQWLREYVLEAEQTGQLTIPALQVEIGVKTMGANTGCVLFHNCDRTTPPPSAVKTIGRQFSTDPVTITVTSVVPEDAPITEIKDIAAPAVLPKPAEPARPLWQWAAGTGSAVVLLLAGWLLWQRRRTPELPVADNAVRPIHEWALQALTELQPHDFIARHQIEEFYMQLSAIVRRYIAERFALQTAPRTSDELLSAMTGSPELDMVRRHQLKVFLQHCDLVKFARHPAAAGDMQQALQQARDFIEQTAAKSVRDDAHSSAGTAAA